MPKDDNECTPQGPADAPCRDDQRSLRQRPLSAPQRLFRALASRRHRTCGDVAQQPVACITWTHARW